MINQSNPPISSGGGMYASEAGAFGLAPSKRTLTRHVLCLLRGRTSLQRLLNFHVFLFIDYTRPARRIKGRPRTTQQKTSTLIIDGEIENNASTRPSVLSPSTGTQGAHKNDKNRGHESITNKTLCCACKRRPTLLQLSPFFSATRPKARGTEHAPITHSSTGHSITT